MQRSIALTLPVMFLALTDCSLSDGTESTGAESSSLSAGIAFKQGVSGELGGPATSLQLKFNNVQSGDLLVGWFLNYDSPGQVRVVDSVNGTWTRSASQHFDGGSGGDVALYYKANSASGNVTVTVSTSAATYIQGTAAEYAGVSTTAPLDQVKTSFGNGATASVGPTGALSASNELVFAATSVGGSVSSMAAGSGFALRSSPSEGATGEEDRSATSTAAQSSSMTFGNSTDWNMVLATFKPAGSSCTPTTCAASGDNCGSVSDGCGGTLNCGTCTAGHSCSNNVCVASCSPTTCTAQGKNCGSLSDGCGGTLNCGTCTTGHSCSNNVCAASCTPSTCSAQGKNCGSVPDGCGGTLNCGTCTAPQSCGGGGAANVCGAAGGTAPPKIMLLLMENHSYDTIIRSSQAPYINSLAKSFASATAWFDVAHPSLPNYLALTAGSVFTTPQDCISTFASPTGDCSFHTTAPNLADQLTTAGVPWKAYLEDLPSACDKMDSWVGNYDVNHNPFMYYDSVVTNPTECNRDVPYSQFATDLANNALPSFIWVSPNLIHDMHDGTIADGDNFLKGLIPQIQASSWYQQGGTILITWDEGETTEQIALIAVSAKNGGKGAFTSQGNHYGTLRGIEEAYGLPLLANAANASNGDITPLLP